MPSSISLAVLIPGLIVSALLTIAVAAGFRRRHAARTAADCRFRASFDRGFQFQFLLDADGRILEVNRAALERAGKMGADVRGSLLCDTMWWAANTTDKTQLREHVRLAAAGGLVQYEQEIVERGGPPMILEIGIKPVAEAGGRVTELLLEARDVTVRRRADAARQGLDTLAAIGRIAARMAHEINNPLAGIQYSFLLIKDAVPADHPYYSSVAAIEREISRIATVTRQLYETYRPEREVQTDASLATIVGDAVAFLEQSNRSSRVRVVTDLTGAPSVVSLSAAVLRQIVYDLVQNAIDASPPDGTVLVAARVAADMLELRVTDSGAGIPSELRQRMFDPPAGANDERIGAGRMGLGMALVRQTVAAAGGTIRVDTTASGGAEFIATLPLATKEVRT